MPAPGAPTGAVLARVSGSDSQIRLTWNYSGTLATSFDVQYWSNVTQTWQAVEPVGENDRSKTIGASANRRYSMRVRGRNGDGWSAWEYGNWLQTTPAAPSGITLSKSTPTAILVKWSNGASTIGGYDYDTILEVTSNGGSSWSTVATLNAGVKSYIHSGRTPGTTYAYRVRARSTVAVTLYSGYSTSSSLTIFSAPAAPSGLAVTRNSDASYSLAWTDNPTTNAPYAKVLVQQSQGGGSWVTVASLGPTANSFTDTSTAANRRYQWRVRAENEIGPSAWVTSNPYQTTPGDPSITSVKAVPGGGLEVTWTNSVGYSAYTTNIRYYKDGVLQTDTISVASGVTSYVLTGVTLTSTYRFGVRARSTIGTALDSAWVDSADTAASTIPSAPTALAPSGVPADFLRAQTFTWQHNPTADGSAQSAYEFRRSTDGGATWVTTGKVTSTASSYTLPASTLTNSAALSWQVRTWGVHATESAWSTAGSVVGSTTPVTSILTPTATHQYSSVEASWSFFDAEGTSQSAWEVVLLDAAGQVLETRTGDNSDSAVTLYRTVEDATDYTLRVRAKDGSALWSDWTELGFSVAYVPPRLPILTVDFAVGAGYAVLTLTPDPADVGAIEADRVSILRRETTLDDPDVWTEWEVIAEDLPPETTVTDTTPALGARTEYMAISYAEV